MRFLVLFLFLFTGFIQAQSKNPDEIVDKVVENFNRVKDYQADVNVKVNVEFLKVPESKATIYFKQPDKIHMESEGFALLPKDGLEFTPSKLLDKNYTAICEQDVILDGFKTSVVKIIPLGDKGNVLLSTLWIDQKKEVIRKVESTTKTNGTFTVNFSYDEKLKYPLPSKVIFSFNIDKNNLPKDLNDESATTQPKKKSKRINSLTKGNVVITYSNYKINKGIPDSVFEDKKENTKK